MAGCSRLNHESEQVEAEFVWKSLLTNPVAYATTDDDGDHSNPRTSDADTTDADGEATNGTNLRVRHPNSLPAEKIEVQEVDIPSGEPVRPDGARRSYDNDLACIVRETVSINEKNIQADGKEQLGNFLLKKVHKRYKFPTTANDEDPDYDPVTDP